MKVNCKSNDMIKKSQDCTCIGRGCVSCEHRPCFPVHVVLETLMVVFAEAVQVC